MSITFPDTQHWQLTDTNGVVVLTIDKQSASANTLDREVIQEFGQIIDTLASHAREIKALWLQSGKKGGFITGADIEEIQKAHDNSELVRDITHVKTLFNRFEALPFIKIALIDGYCLGGGLELALTCDYRLITERSALGLPEVKLGLHPGFAGIARLTRLISNPFKSLPLILQGNTVRGQKAVELGLADACVKTEIQLVTLVKDYVNKPRVSRHFPAWIKLHAVRQCLVKQIEKRLVAKITPEQYPAPFAVLSLWAEYGGDFSALSDAETDSFVKLRATSQAENLIRLYFLQERLKGFGKNEAKPIKHLHVIGAGVMGGDIAAWAALNGIYTSLGDISEATLNKAIERGHKLFAKKRRGDAVEQAKLRLRPDITGWGVDKAEVIIEAAVEKLKAKQAIFQKLEQQAKADALLATNTSSLKIESIATTLSNPQRLIGLHFFNPVAKMPLVEIVKQTDTSQQDIDKAAKFVTQIGRLPLPVKSSPGFLVNRILVPYLFEALLIYREGVDAASIDKAAETFGMPMGPIELADNVGLDVCAHILATMGDVLQGESVTVPELQTRIEAGKLGRKTGEGFYTFTQGKAQKEVAKRSEAEQAKIAERLMMSYLNACAWCLRHHIVEDADLLDAGCVFGTGFAPFRGGPMQYAKTLGKETVIKNLKELERQYGARFAPDSYWENANL